MRWNYQKTHTTIFSEKFHAINHRSGNSIIKMGTHNFGKFNTLAKHKAPTVQKQLSQQSSSSSTSAQ